MSRLKCPTIWMKYQVRWGTAEEQNGRYERPMNFPADRRLIGAIAIIASSLIAASVPFLYHAPLSANTSNNGNGSGSNTNTNPTPTATSSSGPSSSTSNPGSGEGHGKGNGHGSTEDKGNSHSGSSQSHGNGHAHAYGHDKNGDHGKAGLHGKHLGLIKGSHGQGSSSHSFHGKSR